MKNIVIAAVAALTAIASPAAAQDFSGARVATVAGYESVSAGGASQDGVTYGVNAGYDFDLGNVVAGATVEYADSTTDDRLLGVRVNTKRDLSAVIRVGTKLNADTLAFVTGGYTNLNAGVGRFNLNYEGVRAGAGIERKLAGPLFGTVEYRYSNYDNDLSSHKAVVGLGLRF